MALNTDDALEIVPNMNTTAIQKQAFGGRDDLRESQARLEHLEKLAVMATGREVYVQVSGDTAYADLADGESEYGHTDRTIVNVRAEIPEQVATSLDGDEWDLMVQETDLYHELGHVLWTDWPAFESVVDTLDDEVAFFKQMFDLFEDGYIEPRAGARWNMTDEFAVTNENLLTMNKPSGTVQLVEAVRFRLLEEKHDLGWHDELLSSGGSLSFLTSDDRDTYVDDILPRLEDAIDAYMDTDDPTDRPVIVGEFVQDVREDILDGMKDSTDDVDAPLPDEFSIPEDAFEGGDMTPGEEAPHGLLEGAEEADGTEDADPIAAAEKGVSGERDEEIQEQATEAGEDGEDAAESIEEWVRIVSQADYDDAIDSSVVRPDASDLSLATYDADTFDEARRLSTPLAREFEQRLREEQRSSKETKKRSGKVDSSRLHQTQQGSTKVFQKHSEPDDKDYAAAVIVDRSGSMTNFGNERMTPAEEAGGAMAMALEEVGVDVTVLSMFEDETVLEKDFAESVEERKEVMFHGRSEGGTPMSDAVAVARERVEAQGDNPFIIVIGDGLPDKRETYRDQLHGCEFPVVGTYIRDGGAEEFSQDEVNESQYFHALELRGTDDTFAGVKNLVKQIMF